MARNPLQVPREVIELGDICNQIESIHQVSPLRFVKALLCDSTGHGILIQVCPACDHPAVGLYGMVTVKIQASFVALSIRGIIDPDGKLRDILFMQANRAVRRMPAVPPKCFSSMTPILAMVFNTYVTCFPLIPSNFPLLYSSL